MAATVAHNASMTGIRLGGFLGKKYGKKHSFLLDRGDPKEAAKALDANYPGFARDLIEAESRGLRFAVFKNGKTSEKATLIWAGRVSSGLFRLLQAASVPGCCKLSLALFWLLQAFSVRRLPRWELH